MIKKIIKCATIAFTVLLLLPLAVNGETIREEGVVHTFTDTPFFTCNNLNKSGSFHFDGIYNNKKVLLYVEGVTYGDLYYYNENGSCTILTPAQQLAYHNQDITQYYTKKQGTYVKIFKEVTHRAGWDEVYVLTSDVAINPTKDYYNSDHALISEPVLEDISSYYELTDNYYVSPKKYEIEAGKDYYVFNDNDEYEKVSHPVLEDILSYYVIATAAEKLTITEVKSVSLEGSTNRLDTFFNNLGVDNYVVSYINLFDKVYLLARDSSEQFGSYNYYYFDESFNVVNAFTGYDYMAQLNSELVFGYDQSDEILDIYNKDLEKIKTIENFEGFANEVSAYSDENFTYIVYFQGNDAKAMTMYSYKLLSSNNNVNYNGQALSFRFSGLLSSLSSVKVNGVELATSKYTKTDGSTIITLKDDYLKTLKKGSYTLKVGFSDGGYFASEFEIPVANPQTSDNIVYYVVFGLLSFTGLLACVTIYKKKRLN